MAKALPLATGANLLRTPYRKWHTDYSIRRTVVIHTYIHTLGQLVSFHAVMVIRPWRQIPVGLGRQRQRAEAGL